MSGMEMGFRTDNSPSPAKNLFEWKEADHLSELAQDFLHPPQCASTLRGLKVYSKLIYMKGIENPFKLDPCPGHPFCFSTEGPPLHGFRATKSRLCRS